EEEEEEEEVEGFSLTAATNRFCGTQSRTQFRVAGLSYEDRRMLWSKRTDGALALLVYGFETWTLTLREEQRLRVCETKVLKKIFGTKRDEVIGEWRKLHNAELHVFYSSPDIIRNIKSRRLRRAGHVARKDESRNVYRVLVERPEGKRPLGRPRRR
ncbi:hypothetical protein ANN_14329, partial [Periplaneta americana]